MDIINLFISVVLAALLYSGLTGLSEVPLSSADRADIVALLGQS